jgi:hypothetical protein
MQPDEFYPYVMEAMTLPPEARHDRLLKLHTRSLIDYLDVVAKITGEEASAVVEADGRTLMQIVGHIAEWERFAILAAGDILSGITQPRMVKRIEGFLDTEGNILSFETIQAFNAHQAEKYAALPWPRAQSLAMNVASTLYRLFEDPALLSAERLERTNATSKPLENGQRIEQTTMGWALWLIVLEHQAVEHADALKLPEGRLA